jgi:signal transduction histidine kinase
MFSRFCSTIRSRLTCLVIACVLPVWLVVGVLVFHAYSAMLNQINRNVLDTVCAMTMVVDRELSGVQAALQALATSPAFANGDYAGIHRQTLELLKSYPGANIIVADVTGQQLVNSYRPYGDSLPKRKNLETVRSIFESGKPIVSDLFYDAVTRRPMIGIDVPVFRNGKVAYDLAMTFSSDRLASDLASLKLPKVWYGTLLDSKGVVVTRTRNPELFVGRKANSVLQNIVVRSREGTVENTNIEGVPAISTFSRSAVSNWTAVIGVPKATVMAEIYQWMGWAISGAATISLIGIILAMTIARSIAQDIQSLVNPALSIGRGELVATIDTLCIKETEEVATALVHASELLQQRAKERDEAENQLSNAIGLLQRETIERIQATEALLEGERMLIQQSRQAAMGEMISNIAHQWRQPLNSLGLKIQRLLLFYDLGEFNRELLENDVSKSMELIHHMSKTIEDFRNYFRPDKEKVEFKVREAIVNTLSLVEDSLKNQHIGNEFVSKDDPVIYGFLNEFEQALLNILINAKDALIEREIDDPRVTIMLYSEGDCAVITVADNAGGISEEIIDKIFDPYFTTKGPQQGTGVGLFMSKATIEKNMRGRLSVRNIADGAEFRIEVQNEIQI